MNEMLPQPPPNAPAPPPSEAARRSRTWRAWIWGVGIVSTVLVLLALAAPMVIRTAYRPDLPLAINNASQIGLALFEFETKFGTFPDYNTIPTVKESNPTSLVPLGTRTSNDFFRQLIAARIVTSESMFYSATLHGKRPDNRLDGSHALETGECGFAYLIRPSESKHGPDAPIVLYPLIPGERKFDYEFAKKTTNGNAVILRVDGTITSLPIDKSGKVFIHGKDIFDPTQPFWNGKTPDVKWPE